MLELPDSLKSKQVKVVFDATPQDLVFPISSKKKTRNIFYMISGIYSSEDKEYLVLYDVYKRLKRNDQIYIKKIDTNIRAFKTKTQVLNYIYDFIYQFEQPHDKIINTSFSSYKPISFEDYLIKLNAWYTTISEYHLEK